MAHVYVLDAVLISEKAKDSTEKVHITKLFDVLPINDKR